MPVHPSRTTDIAQLLAGFSSPDPIIRESASARLAVLGKRATPGLLALVADNTAPEAGRLAALRTLFIVDLEAGAEAATACVDGKDDALAIEGITLLGEALMEPTRESAADLALEVLSRTALTSTVATHRRLTAINAMAPLPETLRRPLFERLEADANPAIAARARGGPAQHSVIEDWLLTERLPDNPQSAASLIESDASLIAVTGLRRAVDLVRVREREAPDASAWRLVRARLHLALARRGSSIAVYDLRETLERTNDPLEDGFLAAAMTVADATCLEAVAARWATSTDDSWLRDQLERVFGAAAERSQTMRGAAVMAKIRRRWPEASSLLATVPRRRATTSRTPPGTARQ